MTLLQCNTVEQYVHVNPKYHKHFISNRGGLINRISDDCGNVIISFPRSMNRNDSKGAPKNVNQSDSKVTVKGNPEGVKEAIKTIESIVQDLVSWLFLSPLNDMKSRNFRWGRVIIQRKSFCVNAVNLNDCNKSEVTGH